MKKTLLLVIAICSLPVICSCEKKKTAVKTDWGVVEVKTPSADVDTIPFVAEKQTDESIVSDGDSLDWKYLVVVGSFKVKENAERWKEEMEKKDFRFARFQDTVLHSNDTLHRVLIAAFDSVEDAERFRDSNIVTSDIWIRNPTNIRNNVSDSGDASSLLVSVDENAGNNTSWWSKIVDFLKINWKIILFILGIILALLILIGLIYLFSTFAGAPLQAVNSVFSGIKPFFRFVKTVDRVTRIAERTVRTNDGISNNQIKNRNQQPKPPEDRQDPEYDNDDRDDDDRDDDDDIKSELRKLYIRNIPNFQYIHELVRDPEGDIHGPLLMSPGKKYVQQPYPFLAVGQETFGWERFDYPVSEKECEKMMDYYEGFNVGGNYQHKGSPFWSMIRKIEAAIGNETCSCAWTNISKYDKNRKTPDSELERIFSGIDPLLCDEIKIIKPKICIFFTSPRFDDRIKNIFCNAEFLPVSNNKVSQFCRIRHQDLPALTFRTYHPHYLRRKRLEKQIIEEIGRLTVK
jgi:hypothetical protein